MMEKLNVISLSLSKSYMYKDFPHEKVISNQAK